jgi:5-methylcytosine-specific restriction endonuclease McrA
MLHGHHVIPLSCGGADDEANLVLLCANCHGIAHRIGRKLYDLDRKNWIWAGAKTPTQLLKELAWLLGPATAPATDQIFDLI